VKPFCSSEDGGSGLALHLESFDDVFEVGEEGVNLLVDIAQVEGKVW